MDRDAIPFYGWDLDQTVKGESFYYHKNYSIMSKTNPCLIYRAKEETIEIWDSNDNSSISFYGYVENTFEFEILLKMLAINYK